MNDISKVNRGQQKLVVWAAGLSTITGIIHLTVTPDHFEEWIGYGLFFLLVAMAQIGYAVLLMTRVPRPTLLWMGISGNAAVILLWLITRTVGIPFFGPEAWEIEPVGVLDSISKIIEICLIAALAMLLRSDSRIDRK